MSRTQDRPADKQVLKDIWLSFYPGAKIGVLGHNGSGKTTLLRIMAGIDTRTRGEARRARRDGRLPAAGAAARPKQGRPRQRRGRRRRDRALLDRFKEVTANYPSETRRRDRPGLEEQEDQDRRRRAGNLDTTRRDRDGRAALPAGRRRRHQALRRRAPPRRALPPAAAKPDMLLLDEPTNHLDAETVAWLERHLEEYQGTVVAVTHDRYFLDNVAGWILELDRGHGLPFKGNYSGWLEQKQKRLAHEEKQEPRASARSRASSSGCAQNPEARQAKAKARLTATSDLVAEERNASARPSRS